MTHEIIKTDNYLLVVSDDEIKEGDCFLMNYCIVRQCSLHKGDILDTIGGLHHESVCKKIIAHLPLNNSSYLYGVDVLPPLREDVNKLAYEEWKNSDDTSGNPPFIYGVGFNEGYNKAKEKYKYTEFDIIKAFEYGWGQRHFGQMSEDKLEQIQQTFIQSLNQPTLPIAFECKTTPMNLDEIREQGKGFLNANTNKPKTITNSQGRNEWLGTYKY